jgi:hypothetical protein
MGTILKIGGVLAGVIAIYVGYVYYKNKKDVAATAASLASTVNSLSTVTGYNIPTGTTGTVIIKDLPTTTTVGQSHPWVQMWVDTKTGQVAHQG